VRIVDSSMRRRQVVWLFAVAFAWTWGFLGIARLSGSSATESPTNWLRLLAGLGPIVATGLLLRKTDTREERVRFWRRIIDIRSVKPRWWVIAAGAAAGPAVIVWSVGAHRAFDPSGAAAVVGIVGFAAAASFAEEPAWRGYALDRLRSHRPTAALVIATAWAAWHLPLYAIEGTFQHDEVGLGTALFWIFMTALLPQTILMIWVLDHTRPSILPAIVLHALTNISGEVFTLTTGQQAARLTVWALLAAPIVLGWLRGDSPARSHAAGQEPR
jgi:membrane protease YdiL (CAAX protease family)